MQGPLGSNEGPIQPLAYDVAAALRSPLLRLQILCEAGEHHEEVVSEARSLIRLLDTIQLIEKHAHRRQLDVPLTPLSLRPIYEDAVHELTPSLRAHRLRVENYLPRQPFLAHKLTMRLAVEQSLQAMLALPQTDDSDRTLILRARTYGERSDIGLYDTSNRLRSKDLSNFRTNTAQQISLHLRMAEQLMSLQGSRLRSSIYKNYGGLAYSLYPSRQLRLIGHA